MKIKLSTFENVSLDARISEIVKHTLLFATGIVNPFGPTFNAYFIDNKCNVIKMHFHPLNIESSIIGKVKFFKESSEIENILLNQSNFVGSFFSLFLVGYDYKYREFYDFFSELSFLNPSESHKQLAQIRKFPGEPFARVSEEITSSASRIVDEFKKGGQFSSSNKHQTSLVEISEHFDYLTNQQYIKKEIIALGYAWRGSIDHMNIKALVTMPFEEFNQIFSEIICISNLDLSFLK